MAAPESDHAPKESDQAPKGERIAKVIARAGICSRRDAERLIATIEATAPQVSSGAGWTRW